MIDPRIDTYDWQEIFSDPNLQGKQYTRPAHVRERKMRDEAYKAEDVAEILAMIEGESDGADWIGLFKMNDGKFMCVRAGCDYTGWDCQAGGSSDYADTLQDVIAGGLTADERDRLKDQLDKLA